MNGEVFNKIDRRIERLLDFRCFRRDLGQMLERDVLRFLFMCVCVFNIQMQEKLKTFLGVNLKMNTKKYETQIPHSDWMEWRFESYA